MREFTVKTLSLSGNGKNIFRNGDVVKENQLPATMIDKWLADGAIVCTAEAAPQAPAQLEPLTVQHPIVASYLKAKTLYVRFLGQLLGKTIAETEEAIEEAIAEANEDLQYINEKREGIFAEAPAETTETTEEAPAVVVVEALAEEPAEAAPVAEELETATETTEEAPAAEIVEKPAETTEPTAEEVEAAVQNLTQEKPAKKGSK